MRNLPTAIAFALALSGCAGSPGDAGDPDAAASAGAPVTLAFRADELATGSEDYLCFGFDASALAGRAVTRVDWSPPSGGGVTLHHATVYAMQGPFPDGPLSCSWMPSNAVGLHIWAPGDEPLIMPDGFALAVPQATTKMVVQAHVLRLTGAPAAEASVTLTLAHGAPEHLAAWRSTITTVPPIPPHDTVTATSRCRARAAVHTLFAWPHMHRLGAQFQSAIERADGGTSALVDVPAWNVAQERTYRVAIDIAEGDVIETSCTWQNPSNTVVHGGLYTTDEMCTQGIVLWPAGAPGCEAL